jgi:hypothetical protein
MTKTTRPSKTTEASAKVLRQPSPGAKNIKTIDGDTWAASGGTAGIFGRAWREGRLKIIED